MISTEGEPHPVPSQIHSFSALSAALYTFPGILVTLSVWFDYVSAPYTTLLTGGRALRELRTDPRFCIVSVSESTAS
jgi:hypothetical protein